MSEHEKMPERGVYIEPWRGPATRVVIAVREAGDNMTALQEAYDAFIAANSPWTVATMARTALRNADLLTAAEQALAEASQTYGTVGDREALVGELVALRDRVSELGGRLTAAEQARDKAVKLIDSLITAGNERWRDHGGRGCCANGLCAAGIADAEWRTRASDAYAFLTREALRAPQAKEVRDGD